MVQKKIVLLCAESTNKLYIRLINGHFKYDIIESEDSVYTAMVGTDVRYERTTIAASFADVLCQDRCIIEPSQRHLHQI